MIITNAESTGSYLSFTGTSYVSELRNEPLWGSVHKATTLALQAIFFSALFYQLPTGVKKKKKLSKIHNPVPRVKLVLSGLCPT